MLALLLAAQLAAVQTPGAAATPQLRSEPGLIQVNPAYCKDRPTQVIDRYWRPVPSPLNKTPDALRPRPLDADPQAMLELAVDRQIDGCHVRTIARDPAYSAKSPPVVGTMRMIGAKPQR